MQTVLQGVITLLELLLGCFLFMEDQPDKDMEHHHGEGYESERAWSDAGVLEEGGAAGCGGDHAGGVPRERLNRAGSSRDNEAPRAVPSQRLGQAHTPTAPGDFTGVFERHEVTSGEGQRGACGTSSLSH